MVVMIGGSRMVIGRSRMAIGDSRMSLCGSRMVLGGGRMVLGGLILTITVTMVVMRECVGFHILSVISTTAMHSPHGTLI